MDILTINEKPLVQVFKNFVSDEDCNSILEIMRSPDFNWEDAKKVTTDGITSNDHTTIGHMAKYSKIESEKYHQLISKIKQKIAIETGHPLENIREPVPTNYNTNSNFDAHYDFYLVTPELENEYMKIREPGGNRVATAILNLNEDFSGGETYFDRLYKAAWPNKGQLIYFKYDYDDPKINLKTIHTGSTVEYGNKYILTFFIKESDCEKHILSYNKCVEETKLINSTKDIKYNLICGPDWDQRLFSINLPANSHPKNAIAVAVSGMDSILLLYIIAMLNKLQSIPYRILPIVSIPINRPIAESGIAILSLRFLTSEIKRLVNDDFITDLLEITTPLDLNQTNHSVATMANVYNGVDHHWPAKHRNWNIQFVYSGDLERPVLDDLWAQYAPIVNKSLANWWIQPFFNLQKYHIIDCYYQLKIEKLLKDVGTCYEDHKDPHKLHCAGYSCNERRWALMIMNKYDVIPYLLRDWRPVNDN